MQDCNFVNNAAATDGSGAGTGGAVLTTGSVGFTRCGFVGNEALNGGAVGVGGSSMGIFFDSCTFQVGRGCPHWVCVHACTTIVCMYACMLHVHVRMGGEGRGNWVGGFH
jgi:hypothetical protein